MKITRKILSMLLALVMIAGFATVAFAANTDGDVYTYDFAALEKGDELADNALDVFKAAADKEGLVSVATTKIYAGNGTGGAYPEQGGFLKAGTGKLNGQIVLTYADDVKVSKVEIVCHDWYTKSDKYPTNSNTVAVNGSEPVLAPYAEDGTPDTLTFELAESSNVVTIDTNLRAFIFKIVVYTEGEAVVEPTTPEVDKTADFTNPVGMAAVMVLALGAVVAVIVSKKRYA